MGTLQSTFNIEKGTDIYKRDKISNYHHILLPPASTAGTGDLTALLCPSMFFLARSNKTFKIERSVFAFL